MLRAERACSIQDLHPTNPPAYKATTHQPLHLLPPTLRRAHLRHRKEMEARRREGQEEASEWDRLMSLVPPRCDVAMPSGGQAGGQCSHSLSLAGMCTAHAS